MSDCQSCARNGTSLKNKRHFKSFLATRPLEFFAMDILGPLPKSDYGNQYGVVVTDRYSKITRSIPTRQTTFINLAYIFLNVWTVLNGIPNYILTGDSTYFTTECFAFLCTHFGAKQLKTTAYRQQTSGQVVRYHLSQTDCDTSSFTCCREPKRQGCVMPAIILCLPLTNS